MFHWVPDLHSTPNTPIIHGQSPYLMLASPSPGKHPGLTLPAPGSHQEHSTEVAEKALAPSLTQGAQKGVGEVGGFSLTLSLSSPEAHFKSIPGEPGVGCRGSSLRAQSQVGWGLWGTSGHTRHPWDQPTEVYAACKPSLIALCALLGAGLFCSTKGNIRLGDRGDKTAPN